MCMHTIFGGYIIILQYNETEMNQSGKENMLKAV